MKEPWLRWPYIDSRFRSKTHKAFAKALELPQDVLAILNERNITVHAPTAGSHGLVLPAPANRGVLIYLDACLEEESQSYVNYVVMHELAHVFRGDSAPVSGDLTERERLADALVASWGFRVPKHRKGTLSGYEELRASEGFSPPEGAGAK